MCAALDMSFLLDICIGQFGYTKLLRSAKAAASAPAPAATKQPNGKSQDSLARLAAMEASEQSDIKAYVKAHGRAPVKVSKEQEKMQLPSTKAARRGEISVADYEKRMEDFIEANPSDIEPQRGRRSSAAASAATTRRGTTTRRGSRRDSTRTAERIELGGLLQAAKAEQVNNLCGVACNCGQRVRLCCAPII
eukprot:SAG11_NODE_3948_length_2137_cov_1.251717_2_plen_193_part_00